MQNTLWMGGGHKSIFSHRAQSFSPRVSTQICLVDVRWTESRSSALGNVKTPVQGFLCLAGAGSVCPQQSTGLCPGCELLREHPQSADAQGKSRGTGEWFHHTLVVEAGGETRHTTCFRASFKHMTGIVTVTTYFPKL